MYLWSDTFFPQSSSFCYKIEIAEKIEQHLPSAYQSVIVYGVKNQGKQQTSQCPDCQENLRLLKL